MKLFVILFAIVVLLICPPATAKQTQYDELKGGRGHKSNDLDFETVTLQDNHLLDIDAYSIDVPENWDFEGSILWIDSGYPYYTPGFSMTSEDGQGLVLINSLPFVWFDNEDLQDEMPEGSAYDEYTNILEPMNPEEFLEEFLVEFFMQSMSADLDYEIVDVQQDSSVVEKFWDIVDPDGALNIGDAYDGGWAMVELENDDGDQILIRITTVLTYSDPFTSTQGDYHRVDTYRWSHFAGSVEIARAGEFDEMTEVFGDILDSLEWNEDFIDGYWDYLDENYEE